MRKSLTIFLLGCTLFSFAVVPPRDPNRRDAWQRQLTFRADAERQHKESLGKAYSPAAMQAVGSRTLIPRILVIMANFADIELVSSQAEVDSMFNAQNWEKDNAKGSVRQYFFDQSMGTYNPQFDVFGPVTLSQGYAYYGENGAGSVGCMVTEACRLADDEVDFSQYDANNDGRVDLVFVFYAGFGQNDPPKNLGQTFNETDLIWPAYWNVIDAGYCNNQRTFDGKTVYACEFSNELDGYYSTVETNVAAGIGVVCHEFCHAIGLPDLYATGKEAHTKKLLGGWDIMCNGPYNDDMHSPPSFSAYERFYMGWLTPTLITEPDTLTLEHIATSNKAYLISENDHHNLDGLHPDTTVFYLLENRQRAGWDRGLQGSGMLLTRINFNKDWWTSNCVNSNSDNLGVDIIEADGDATADAFNSFIGYWGKPGDAFPYGAKEYTGITGHEITDISMSEDGIITFVYRGGKTPTPVEMPSANSSIGIPKAYKTIDNGRLIIHSNGHTYSVLGIRLGN